MSRECISSEALCRCLPCGQFLAPHSSCLLAVAGAALLLVLLWLQCVCMASDGAKSVAHHIGRARC
jgi:hypothetical protein